MSQGLRLILKMKSRSLRCKFGNFIKFYVRNYNQLRTNDCTTNRSWEVFYHPIHNVAWKFDKPFKGRFLGVVSFHTGILPHIHKKLTEWLITIWLAVWQSLQHLCHFEMGNNNMNGSKERRLALGDSTWQYQTGLMKSHVRHPRHCSLWECFDIRVTAARSKCPEPLNNRYSCAKGR